MSELPTRFQKILESQRATRYEDDKIEDPFDPENGDKSRLRLSLESLDKSIPAELQNIPEKFVKQNLQKSRVGMPFVNKFRPRRDPRKPLSDDERTRIAMSKDYGTFPDYYDPTGMIETGNAAETLMLKEVQESIRKLEALKPEPDVMLGIETLEEDPEKTEFITQQPSVLERARKIQKDKDEKESKTFFDIAMTGVQSTVFGTQKKPAFGVNVPIEEVRLDQHAGIVGAAEGLADLALIAIKELPKLSGGAFRTLVQLDENDEPVVRDIFTDLSNLSSYFFMSKKDAKAPTVYSKFHFMAGREGVQDAYNIIGEYLEQGARGVLGNYIRDEESLKQFYNSVRNPLAVDLEDRNSLNIGLAVFGLFAPWAGTVSGVNAGRVLKKYIDNTVLVSHFAKRLGFMKTFVNMDALKGYKQLFDTNVAQRTFPDLGDTLQAALKNDLVLAEHIEKLTKRGISPEKAKRQARNRRRDFYAGAGGGAMYAIFERLTDSEGLSLGASIFGALFGNGILTSGRRQLSKRKMNLNGLLARFNSAKKEDRDKAIEAFKNSDSQNMNQYKETFLRMQGLTGLEIKEAARESLDMGNAAMKSIRKAEKEGSVQLGTVQYSAADLRAKYISEGVLNDKGRPHQFHLMNVILDSKFNKQTLDFGAEFYKRVLTGQDGERFRVQMQQMHLLVDELHSIAPKAMEKFPLLLEQVTNFAALQAMRNSLMNQVEFSARGGRVINGRYLSEAERYHDLLTQQSDQLTDVLKELRNSDAKNSELFKDFLNIISDGIGARDLGYKSDQIVELKKLAKTNRNEELQQIEDNRQELVKLSQVDHVGDVAKAKQHGQAQLSLIQQGFNRVHREASKPFEDIKNNKKFQDLKLNIAPFLETAGPEFLKGEAKSIERLLNFTGLNADDALAIKRDIARNYLKNTLEISKTPSLNFYENEFASAVGNIIEQSFQGTDVQKQQIFESLFLNANNIAKQGDIPQAIDLVLGNMLNIIDFPAPVGIETFMKIRQAMGQNQRTAYNQKDFATYRELTKRLDQLDEAIGSQSILGQDFIIAYRNARSINKNEMAPYRDPKSPFSKYDNVNIEGRQPLSSHRLFELLHKGEGSAEQNAREFDKIYFDSKTGKYRTFELLDENGDKVLDSAGNAIIINPIEELIYSFATRITKNDGSIDPAAVEDILSDSLLVYADVFNKAGPKYANFLKTVKNYVKHNTVSEKASVDDRKFVSESIFAVLNSLKGSYADAFNQSAVAQLGGSSAKLDELGMIVQESLKDTGKFQEQSLLIGGRSLDFNTADYFNRQLRQSDAYLTASDEQRSLIELTISNPNFIDIVENLTGDPSMSAGKRAIATVISDGQKQVDAGRMSVGELDKLKDTVLIMIGDNFTKKAFPFVEKQTLLNSDKMKPILEDISNTKGTQYSGLPIRTIKQRLVSGDANLRNLLRQKGFSGVTGKTFKINLQNEFDPIAANEWWKENKELYEILYRNSNGAITEKGQKHIQALDVLLEIGTRLSTMGFTQSVKGTPTPYSTQMLLGRVYNAVGKRVVSPTYIGMENMIVNYRLIQGDIIQSILTSPETANVFADIYARGLFKPREAQDVIRDFAVRVGQFGVKMSLSQENALMDFYKEEAETPEKIIEKDKK